MTRSVPTAVVFDLGNVLIRWEPRPAVAAGVGDEEAARFLSAEDFDFFAWNHEQDCGRSVDEALRELARSHPHWREHAGAYVDHFGLSLSPIDVNVAVLRDLHARGVPVFALTNWAAQLFPHARTRFGFLALFEDIVVSGEEGVAKPDPAVFDVLLDRVGRPLTECVFVDDSAANADAGAVAGLDAIRYEPTTDLRAELARRGLPV